jgi:glycosyltransferase involved in cell wall biosynthesis
MKCLVPAIMREAPQHQYFCIIAPGTEHLLECVGDATMILCSAKYYSLAEQLELPSLLRSCNADLLHALHFVVPLVKCCPTVVTIHDAVHLVYPQDLSWVGRLYSRFMLSSAIRVADRVLTVSEYSKSDIARRLHANPDKILVAYPGVDDNFTVVRDPNTLEHIRRKIGVSKDYILYSGIFKQRKNHIGLLKAFSLLLATGTRAQLVIAGPLGEGERMLRNKATELGIAEQVIFAGFVPERDLPTLYSGATIYACPSLYEGFGFTVLEAMACGTPVVSHTETSLPEVCGDAALFANAANSEQFATALRRVMQDTQLRSELIRRGYDNVTRFSWAKGARQTLDTYECILHGPLPAASARAAATT